jgi:hypothetical protein
MYNYWVSQEAEMLALAPKAPFIGYGGQFEGYEDKWKTANTTNWPYLEVNPDVTDGAGAVLPLPQRAQPPMASSGLLQAKAGASDDIKSSTGQYDSSLGATSNERSGRAILAREKQSDTGTYHYVDNLARAIRYCGRQLVDMIPKIYDTERIARIIGIDGEVKTAKMNPMQEEPVKKIVDETGIVIENTETRSQLGNREKAMQLLRSQLYEIELRKRAESRDQIEAGKKKIEWGSQIRSYVLDDRRVKDHRTDYTVNDPDKVLDGELTPFLKAYLMEYGG